MWAYFCLPLQQNSCDLEDMDNQITSSQNPKVKRVTLLQQKSSERRRSGLFVVEGQREIEHCIEAGYEVDSLFVCQQLLSDGNREFYTPDLPSDAVYVVTPQVYEKMAYRGSTEGLLAVVRSRQKSLGDLHLSDNPLIVVLERVEKPGNLGAVLRSADAAQADAVIVCDPLTDLYNPNLIRSSIGAIFTVPCVALRHSCKTAVCIKIPT